MYFTSPFCLSAFGFIFLSTKPAQESFLILINQNIQKSEQLTFFFIYKCKTYSKFWSLVSMKRIQNLNVTLLRILQNNLHILYLNKYYLR